MRGRRASKERAGIGSTVRAPLSAATGKSGTLAQTAPTTHVGRVDARLARGGRLAPQLLGECAHLAARPGRGGGMRGRECVCNVGHSLKPPLPPHPAPPRPAPRSSPAAPPASSPAAPPASGCERGKHSWAASGRLEKSPARAPPRTRARRLAPRAAHPAGPTCSFATSSSLSGMRPPSGRARAALEGSSSRSDSASDSRAARNRAA
jgi:hypothetical protein